MRLNYYMSYKYIIKAVLIFVLLVYFKYDGYNLRYDNYLINKENFIKETIKYHSIISREDAISYTNTYLESYKKFVCVTSDSNNFWDIIILFFFYII